MMFSLRTIFLIQVGYVLQHTFAQNTSLSASLSPSVPASSQVSLTVSLNTSAGNKQGSVSLATTNMTSATKSSQQASASASNDLLNNAKDLLNSLNNGGGSGGGDSSSSQTGTCEQLNWTPEMKCSDKMCSEAYIEKINNLFKCLNKKPDNVSLLDLGSMIQNAAMRIAESLMEKVKTGTPNNVTYTKAYDNFVVFSGVLDDVYINNTKETFARLPNYSDPSSLPDRWGTVRDEISVPIEELFKRASSYWPFVLVIHSNLVEDRPLKMTEIETDYNELIKDSDLSDLYLEGNDLKSKKKPQPIYINTNVLSFNLKQAWKDMKKPLEVTLKHKKVGSLEKPVCVFWDTKNSIWSKRGCHVQDTNSTHTICACNHLTSFAVAMKEKTVEDLSLRESLVTLAIVFGTISLILLVACAVCIFVVGYHFVDNMRIALNLDLSLILCHLFFFIGLSSSASKYLATPEVCEVISPFVHMFELAALSFLLMEGLHYYDKFKQFFSKKNTRTFYIYLSLGWGIPIAFGAAVAGYTYKHHGSPIRNEFCWMSVYGDDAMYFGTPVLILALLNLIVRAFVLRDVMAWKGDPDNLNIERTKTRLISAMVLLPVIILTWLLGILATNHSEQKEFHFFFVIFHALQGILVFIFYCARNSEMWAYFKDKKQSHEAQKNAVYSFQYVP